jgi:pimeloyl-ACP methyl ester carboxylesterase
MNSRTTQTGTSPVAAMDPASSHAHAAQSATSAITQFVSVNGRTLAYRSVGRGEPIILCNRFRGVLDTWDPAFIDALAKHFRVLTFDYSGMGRSTGKATFENGALAKDAKDLADALELRRVVIGGWSLGGTAAQTFALLYPNLTSHAVLIGTGPPGANRHPHEQLFFERALKPDYDLDDETVLFFEPKSAVSRAAAKRSHDRIAERTADLDIPIPRELYLALLKENDSGLIFPDHYGLREKLMAASTPILIVSGDHDIIFPVENWYDISRELATARHFVVSQSGHGPQHQVPETVAECISAFVNTTR